MPAVARTTKAIRTISGSCRRCAAVPAATPASSRPERGRTSGGRGSTTTGVVTTPIVAPGAPRPPPGPPVRPQLPRSSTDKMIGGVAGGLAEYSGVDALLWRVGFVALTLAGGSGILVYLLLWLLMPAGPPGEPGGSG